MSGRTELRRRGHVHDVQDRGLDPPVTLYAQGGFRVMANWIIRYLALAVSFYAALTGALIVWDLQYLTPEQRWSELGFVAVLWSGALLVGLPALGLDIRGKASSALLLLFTAAIVVSLVMGY